ncbi:hypothetical protein QJS10_CPB22g01059 [Acorus calamus]|uniref:Leucine-rich repeat-containing N-terminal plant-type domain-containing protein n=1 Tax=Acorus calamus TaxID=4465 RepID=A0AAV9C102_ACOCL|nr:hypothetical protein QJS10_CPB22g01059 [Acorus calamus]
MQETKHTAKFFKAIPIQHHCPLQTMDSSTGSSTLLILSLFSVLFSTEFLLCASQTYLGCFESDRKALLDFKTTLLDPSNHLASWRGLACCAWRGIRCDNRTGLVIHIDLRGLGLSSSTREFASSLPRLTGLRRLDLSSNSFEADTIPQSICSSQNLRYLNLSNSGFGGRLPPQLGNLSRLRFFDVSSPGLSADDLSWVSDLSSLKTLSMNGVDLSRVDSDWVRLLNKLSSLVELQLSGCSLPSIAPFLHNSINFTSLVNIDLSFNAFSASTILGWISNITSLEHIDISNNNMRGSVPLQLSELPHLKYLSLAGNHNLTSNISELLSGQWSRIETLTVADNQVFGEIPPSIGNITSLVELDFFSNHIEGRIPSSIGKLCKLKSLNLAGNNLSLQLPESLERSNGCNSTHLLPNLESFMLSVNGIQGTLPKWLGEPKRLVMLDVTLNSIQGPIPESLSKLSRLTNLGLGSNALNGSLPPGLGELSNLVYLDISSNQLSGFLSEAHFLKLSKLKILIASSNSLSMNVSSDWVPPFRLRNLDMGSIRLGPSFPPWLETQKSELMFLDLSNTSINDEMPSWFWDQLSSNLSLLNISFNQIRGELPNPLKVPAFADVSMKSNLFEGPLPNLSNGVELLDLSDNRISGSIPPNIGKVSPYLIFLSLSGNSLSGLIPPSSIGEMQSLQVLDLSNNNLTGPIPTNLYNCSFLKALDLGHNNLTGTILLRSVS